VADLDLNSVLEELAQRRPLFHSEADFQHELAWELRESWKPRAIRLEWPVTACERPGALDLMVETARGRVGIELKYWKKAFVDKVLGEPFALKNQAAQDISRYDFWKDVARIEDLVAHGVLHRGYVVALTLDQTYWNESTRPTVDIDFRLHEGRAVEGPIALEWRGASEGTMRGERTDPIPVRGGYRLGWLPYSSPREGVELRALVLSVISGNERLPPEQNPGEES
jgi:hypothetical protein